MTSIRWCALVVLLGPLACGSSDGNGDSAAGAGTGAGSAAASDATSGSGPGTSGPGGASTSGASTGGAGVGGAGIGGSAAGFTPESGVSLVGTLAHGGLVTIERPGGGFGARAHAHPWLWDVVAEQYLDGTNLDAYAGISDAEAINTDVWTYQTLYQGWDVPEHHFKYTEQGLRHPRLAAEYGNFAKSPSDPKPYSKLAIPRWPDAWGAQDNAQMYLSWWQRMNGASPGYPQDGDGNGGEDKPLRFGDTDFNGLGSFDITVAGLTGDTEQFGNVKSWGSWPDPGAAWHRVELFIDRTTGIGDLFVDGHLQIGSSWTANPDDGGPFEFRPDAQYLYVAPPTPGTAFATSSWNNVTVHWLGFDDGGVTTKFAPGRDVELSEIYIDASRARVELSSAATWEQSPDAERTSEVQGRLVAWSDTEIQLELNQGAFGSLGGLYLWAITGAGDAILLGHFDP